MKACLALAVVLFALAAVLYLLDSPPASRVAPALVALGLVALTVAQWPGLAA